MAKNRLKIRLILFLILFLAIFCFIYLAVVPSGHIIYKNDFSKNPLSGQGFLAPITPIERVNIENGQTRITGDPVYFSLFTPRKFEKVRLTIKYQNLNEAKYPIVEAGVLMNKVVWNYQMQPLENKLLENLAAKWNKIEENGLIFLQREKKFNSLDEFLKSDLKREEVALSNYDLKQKFSLPNYQANLWWRDLPKMRGAYEFYVYLKNEDLNLKLEFKRQEELVNKDEIIIVVTDENDKNIYEENISDAKNISLNLKNLSEGVYKIAVRTSDNIVTDKFSTTQSKLVFNNRLWAMQSLAFWSNSPFLKARTINPGSLGDIMFGGEKFNINQTYEPLDFYLKNAGNLTEIKTSQPDLIMETNGLFALSLEFYFNPEFKRLNGGLDLDQVNYIIANYQAPQIIDGYKVATVDFEISNAYQEFGKNSFMISAPGLKGDMAGVVIKEIKIELWGRTLLDKIRSIFN
jgi:hypothetical protein